MDSEKTNFMSLKAAKEAFVTGLSGTSKLEIFALVAALSLSIVVCEHLKSRRQQVPLRLALELLLVIYPHLLICTGALPLWPTLLAFAAAAMACSLRDATRPCGRAARHELPGALDLAGPRKSFVGIFRGALMAATCLCILAVDFRAFPRRYAKAEAYGTGYMDVGVGGVILTAGLVSPVCRPAGESGGGEGKERDGGARRWKPPPLWRRLLSGLRGAAACWALGLARLLTTRAVDYQEHVGEYGVHWNFFDTVALVALLGQAVALPPQLLAPAAVAATAAHQAALTLGGLGPWVMSPERDSDLLSLNKEGLVSCVGFWALYLWGAALAHAFHVTVQPAVRHLRREPSAAAAAAAAAGGASLPGGGAAGAAAAAIAAATAAGKAAVAGSGGAGGGAAPLVRWWAQLAALDGLLWVVVAALEARVEPISRRSCNAAYIMWIAAQCLAGMLPLALWQALATAAAGDGGGGGGGGGASAHQNAGGSGGSGRSKGMGSDRPSSGAAEAVGAGKRPLVAGPGSSGPRVLQAINANQLAIFLAANLMTGAVNLSMDTLQVSDWTARALLGAYITCVCGLALLLDARGWRIKL